MVGVLLLTWAERRIASAGRSYSRLDYVSDDDGLERNYARLGYVAVGTNKGLLGFLWVIRGAGRAAPPW